MQTVTLVSAFVLVAVALLTAPQTADASCCKSGRHHGRSVCGDCSHPTPYCGYGKCNIFGCSCHGGCRRGGCHGHGKRSVDDEPSMETAEELVSAGDMNGDGVLSFEEAETMLEQRQGPSATHRRSVRSLDKNLDGLLSANEIDY